MSSSKSMSVKFFLFFFVVFLSSAGNSLATDDPIQLKLASYQPSTSKCSEELKKWGDLIEKETNGAVKFVYYTGATLAKASDTYDTVVNGLADIGWTFSGYTRGRFTLSEVITLPLGLKNASTASKVLCDLYDKYPQIRDEYKDVHLLWLSPSSPRQIHSRVPIRNVDDFKGLKVRVPGSEAPYVKALKGVPVSIAGPEVYEALERGVLDVDLHPWEGAITYRWYEVVTYHIEADLYSSGLFIFAMNNNSYKKLPSDVRKVIDKYSGRHGSIEISGVRMWDQWEPYFKDWLKTHTKNEVSELSEAEKIRANKMISDIAIPKWIKAANAKGAPGKQILNDCINLIKKYK